MQQHLEMLKLAAALGALGLLSGASANDPSKGWLTYVRPATSPLLMPGSPQPGCCAQATWNSPAGGRITMLNTTWKVPSLPSDMNPRDSSAPGWWFGIQTGAGDGALIQPILAWGYTGAHYSMFNGVFDWTDVSWRTSPEVFTVQPGDTLVRCAAAHPKQQHHV